MQNYLEEMDANGDLNSTFSIENPVFDWPKSKTNGIVSTPNKGLARHISEKQSQIGINSKAVYNAKTPNRVRLKDFENNYKDNSRSSTSCVKMFSKTSRVLPVVKLLDEDCNGTPSLKMTKSAEMQTRENCLQKTPCLAKRVSFRESEIITPKEKSVCAVNKMLYFTGNMETLAEESHTPAVIKQTPCRAMRVPLTQPLDTNVEEKCTPAIIKHTPCKAMRVPITQPLNTTENYNPTVAKQASIVATTSVAVIKPSVDENMLSILKTPCRAQRVPITQSSMTPLRQDDEALKRSIYCTPSMNRVLETYTTGTIAAETSAIKTQRYPPSRVPIPQVELELSRQKCKNDKIQKLLNFGED